MSPVDELRSIDEFRPTDVAERWVRSGGFRTRYLEAGAENSEPVLLLHDGAWGGSSSATWGPLIPFLAERYRVLAPDMLGFGGTDKAIFVDRSTYSFRIAHLAEFLRTLDIVEPIHVVGNSFGGSVALRALTTPEAFDIKSVVSVAGAGGHNWRTLEGAEQLGRWDGTREDLARVTRFLIDETPEFEAHLDERFKWASMPGHVKAVKAATVDVPEALKSKIADSWPAPLASTATPVLLVSCLRDKLLKPEWAEELRAVIPGALTAQIDDRHCPGVDRPQELNNLLMNFFHPIDSK